MADFDDEATIAEEDRLIEIEERLSVLQPKSIRWLPDESIQWLLEYHYEYGKACSDPLDLMRMRQLKRELLKRKIQGDKT